MKENITAERLKLKLENDQMRMEEERNKLSMPRFETMEEKQLRLQKEQELKEFGEVAVSFRLSHLNPQFTYFLDDRLTQPTATHADNNNHLQPNKKKKTVHYENLLSLSGSNRSKRSVNDVTKYSDKYKTNTIQLVSVR